jgi:uncharacterized protein (TIGR02246 family)
MSRSFGSASVVFADAHSTVRGLTQDLCTAFNTGNYDQWAALFAPDGQLRPPNHAPVQGPKAIERVLRALGESGQHNLSFETAQIVLSNEMAVEIGRYTVGISEENGTITPQRGKYLRVWWLGAWLIVADWWNSNLPADNER